MVRNRAIAPELPDPARHLRRVRSALALILAAVVAGAAALVTALALEVHEPLSQLQRIGDDHARVVLLATRIRHDLASSRRALVQRVLAGRAGAPTPPGLDEAMRGLGDAAAAIEPFVEVPEEQASLQRLRGALGRYGAAARRTVDALRRDPRRAGAELPAVLDSAGDTSAAADELVSINARQMQALAAGARRSLAWTLALTTAALVLLFGAMLLLLRRVALAVRAYSEARDLQAEELTSFSARAAHELRTPLGAIALALEAARRGSVQALGRADRCARRLAETIDGLLEFSRAGARRPECGATAGVQTALEEVLEELEARRRQAGAQLVQDVPEALRVRMPQAHLRTVLRNLIANAIKYGAGGGAARVEIRARAAADAVTIEVQDHGPGIAPEARARVFEPFFRASATPGGFGLGLATVRRLVLAHDGAVELTSAVGAGTTVSVRLLRAAAEDAAAGALHAPPRMAHFPG